jgi:hypothetical protein
VEFERVDGQKGSARRLPSTDHLIIPISQVTEPGVSFWRNLRYGLFTPMMPEHLESPSMSTYTLERGEHLYRVICECCSTQKKRVWGFVSKARDAHAVYYAPLNVADEQPRVGLTLSIGPWWDEDKSSQRSWVHMQIRSTDNEIQMAIREPQDSRKIAWAGFSLIWHKQHHDRCIVVPAQT